MLTGPDLSEVGPEWIQNWTCFYMAIAGSVSDPFRTSSRMLLCKQKADWVRFSDLIHLKTSGHNHSMSNFGLFFFFIQLSWIFACGLRLNRKSQPCSRLLFILQKALLSFLHTFVLENEAQTSEKNTGLWFSVKLETTCKNSAYLDKKKPDQNLT